LKTDVHAACPVLEIRIQVKMGFDEKKDVE
jgi:hypothetical protein